MTIQLPNGDPPFEADLAEHQSTSPMLWLHQTNSRGRRMGFQVLLSAALTLGWRVVRASPEEQALLEAHGLPSGRIQ